MTRALVTFAVGPHQELLDITLPSFQAFADRHGYDLLVGQPDPCERPPSWWKIPLLQDTLQAYDEVLWLDADIVIADTTEDLPVPARAWQALVEHHTSDGEVPNLGVWYLRRPMRRILDAMWGADEYLWHCWWEQAAMLDLLGYQHEPRPCRQTTTSVLCRRTAFLGLEWNVHRNDHRRSAGRFLHATMWPDRAAVMRAWMQEALCAS